MEFHLARDGSTFGPYTEAEIREQLASGHILPTDIARTDAMQEWLPVATLFPVALPPAADPLPGGLPRAFANPPNLHWVVVLVLSILTVTTFSIVWSLVQAAWLKRVNPRSTALLYYIAFAILWLLKAPQTWHAIQFNLGLGLPATEPFALPISLLSAVFFLTSHLIMRKELLKHYNRDEPIGLNLSWLLSLVFGDIYFQYHLNRIVAMKHTLGAITRSSKVNSPD